MDKRQTGFSLSELMIVTAIAAILLGIAIPSYKYLTTSYRMSAELNNLVGDMQFARAEALKEGTPVTVCISSDGANCTGGTNWAPGWIVFSDANRNQSVDAGERVLKFQGAFSGTNPDALAAGNGINYVTYNREGFASTAAGFVTSTLSLTEAGGNNAYTRCLLVSPTGMLTSQNHVGSPTTC
jgi:type IV fimbrial biogenesis protein FimT